MDRRKLTSAAYCLGQTPHAIADGAILCPLCHCLRAQATIGYYQILQRLGRGRSGDAYVVQHLRLHQPAVLKFFPPDHSSRPLWESARREIRTVTALKHPTILPIFQCTLWNPDTQLLSSPLSFAPTQNPSGTGMTQEHLLTFCRFAPFSLAHIIEGGSLLLDTSTAQVSEPITWTLGLVAAIGNILSLTHSIGIAHGAVIPGNILYAPGHFWLADFGLASLHPPFSPYLAPELENEIHRASSDQKFTAFWLARSPASDQYSLAITYKQLFYTILPQAINDRMAPILQRALQANPLDRFESIAQLTQALIERLTAKRNPQAKLSEIIQDTLSTHTMQNINWEEQGNNAFRAHNYDLAVQAYRQATILKPRNPTLWAALGDSFFAINQHKDAVEAYNKALRLDPKQADIWMNRGTALEQLGRMQDAQACYERAAQLREQQS